MNHVSADLGIPQRKNPPDALLELLVPNLFVMGASAFPHNSGYNPTGTLSALALWSAAAIRKTYLKNPGPLVQT